MANKKISEFTETTTPAETDMLLIATDPAGADITKKVAKSNLTLKWAGQELPALESGKFLSNDGAVLSWESAGTGTVTSVAMSVPTGLSISGSPITTSGTLALSFAAGYSLPTDVKQGQWDAAYGWGDHSLEGYLKSVAMDDISDVDTTGVTDGQVLAYDDLTATWLPVDLAGGGDVVGPAAATDNAIARFDGATGKAIQNSGITVDDNNNIAGAASISISPVSGNALLNLYYPSGQGGYLYFYEVATGKMLLGYDDASNYGLITTITDTPLRLGANNAATMIITDAAVTIGTAAYDRLEISGAGDIRSSIWQYSDALLIMPNAFYTGAAYDNYDTGKHSWRVFYYCAAAADAPYITWSVAQATAGAPSFTELMRLTETGELQLEDGTAALPAFTFNAQTNLGFYRYGSNILSVACAGALKFWFDSSSAGHYTFNHLNPNSAGVWSSGTASNYWGDISYKTITDRGCLGSFDEGVELQDGRKVSDVQAIKEIKVHPTQKTVYGVPRLDYSTMPKAVYKPAPIAEEETKEPDGRVWKKGEKMGDDGAETTALISIMLGAIKELDARLTTAEARIAELEKKPAK